MLHVMENNQNLYCMFLVFLVMNCMELRIYLNLFSLKSLLCRSDVYNVFFFLGKERSDLLFCLKLFVVLFCFS